MKISKKILANKVRKLEVQNYDMRQKIKKMDKALTYLDELTTELNHALPDPEYDAKCEAVADVEGSLNRHRERLGLNKPQLKQLDQSVFDGQSEEWTYAAVNKNSAAWLYKIKPAVSWSDPVRFVTNRTGLRVGIGYDTTDWQNSLIERDIAKELTGSDLCRKMLERGDKWVVCKLADTSEEHAIENSRPRMVTEFNNGFYQGEADMYWQYAVPINSQGEPLTAAEVGL